MTSGTFPRLDVQGLQDCVITETSRPDTRQHAVQRILADLPDNGVCDRIVLVDGGYAPLLATRSGNVHVVNGDRHGSLDGRDAKDRRVVDSRFRRFPKSRDAINRVSTTVERTKMDLRLRRDDNGESATPVEITIPQPSNRREGKVESLLLACVSTRPECVLHPRVMLRLQPDSRLDLVEWHAGETSERYTSNSMLHVVLEPGSCLRHTRVVCEGEAGQHEGHVAVTQHARSAYQLTDISIGGAWRRTRVTVDLLEPDAHCCLHGLAAVWGKQAGAHDMTVRHGAPDCSSDQLCKGLYAGASRGAFHGLVAVPSGAVATNARQLNRNLLLSPAAHVWTQPRLEIETDAVTCSHGATVSQLEDQTLFYLRSRGVAPDRAAGLLANAFAAEIVDGIKPAWAKSFAQPRVDRALEKCLGDVTLGD